MLEWNRTIQNNSSMASVGDSVVIVMNWFVIICKILIQVWSNQSILSLYRAVQHLSPPLVQFLLIIPSFSLQPSPFASSSSFLSMLCKLPLPFPTHHNSFSEIAKKISKISHSNFIPKCSSFQETSFSDNLSLERFGVECASDSCQVNPVLSSIKVKCCLKSLKSKLLVSHISHKRNAIRALILIRM